MGAITTQVRLTQYARGGGCACKIPPDELETLVAALDGLHSGAHPREINGVTPSPYAGELLVGLATGDDAAVVRIGESGGTVGVGGARTAIVSTADFFTPVVDDAYDWGRIAAANALSDIYAMGGTPLVAVNLLCWPRDVLAMELAAEVIRGGRDIAALAGCHVGGGHSVDDPEPKYGMAVTGLVDPNRLLRNDAAQPGLPLTLTKPLGTGVLNSRHKATGEVFPHAIATMTQLNRDASVRALQAGASCATDVTGFGLLGHLHKLARASGVTAVLDAAAIPYLDGARAAAEAGHISGGTRRNLAWVTPYVEHNGPGELEMLLLADAQTSGGLLVAGEIPGHPVIGELVRAGTHGNGVTVVVRGARWAG